MSQKIFGGLLLAAALSACGGGEPQLCDAIGGTATATPATGSTISDAARAADGNADSFATLQPPATGSGGGTLRATAGRQAGSGFAGVLLSRAPSGQNVQITITTYLAGVQQDSNTAGSDLGGNNGTVCSGICIQSGGDRSYFGISVSRAYDAIQVGLQTTGTSAPVQVRELCKR